MSETTFSCRQHGTAASVHTCGAGAVIEEGKSACSTFAPPYIPDRTVLCIRSLTELLYSAIQPPSSLSVTVTQCPPEDCWKRGQEPLSPHIPA